MDKRYAVITDKGDIQVTLTNNEWDRTADSLILDRLSKEIHKQAKYIAEDHYGFSHHKRPDKYRKAKTVVKLEYLLSIYYGFKIEVKMP